MTASRCIALMAGLLLVSSSVAADEDGLRDALTRFSKAFREAQVETLRGMLTEDYIHTNYDGSVYGRDAWLGWVATQRTALEDGSLRYEAYIDSDLVIVQIGDAAVVSGVNRAAGVRDRETFDRRIRFTHLWVHDGTSWKRAAFHDSRLPQVPEDG